MQDQQDQMRPANQRQVRFDNRIEEKYYNSTDPSNQLQSSSRIKEAFQEGRDQGYNDAKNEFENDGLKELNKVKNKRMARVFRFSAIAMISAFVVLALMATGIMPLPSIAFFDLGASEMLLGISAVGMAGLVSMTYTSNKCELIENKKNIKTYDGIQKPSQEMPKSRLHQNSQNNNPLGDSMIDGSEIQTRGQFRGPPNQRNTSGSGITP